MPARTREIRRQQFTAAAAGATLGRRPLVARMKTASSTALVLLYEQPVPVAAVVPGILVDNLDRVEKAFAALVVMVAAVYFAGKAE